jgi:hypothetical protein
MGRTYPLEDVECSSDTSAQGVPAVQESPPFTAGKDVTEVLFTTEEFLSAMFENHLTEDGRPIVGI